MLPIDAADERAGRAPRRATLSDGRAILYFDDADRLPRPAPTDERGLSRPEMVAELRRDRLLDEWIIVATHRQDRTHLPAARDCPLCPTRTAGAATEVPADAYDVVVFENRFPSLPAAVPGEAPAGRAEVICYASDHDASFSTLPAERLDTIAAAWVHRSVELAAQAGVAYVLPFENRGEQIGVTLHHPHGQVYAYPFVPPRIGRMVSVADATDGCLGCAELERELAGERVVAAWPLAIAYVPEAARWPYEVHVVPRRHVASLADSTIDERAELVRLQADVLARLDRLFDRPAPYMAGWLQAPVTPMAGQWHLRLQVVSPQRDAAKLKFLAGSESLAGAFINDVRPEVAAARLRDAG